MSERDEYTPTLDQVRNNMALGVAVAQACASDGCEDLPRDINWPPGSNRPEAKKQFDRWLAAHGRAVREQVAQEIEADMARLQRDFGITEDCERGMRFAASIARGRGSE